jgi:DNA-binding MurR/RpiR family transcriptional regulator
MSAKQRNVARVVLSRYKDAAFLTARALAREAGVSEATVVRFAAFLGYPSYAGLQRHLQDLLREELTMSERLRLSRHEVEAETDLVTRVAYREIEHLEELLRGLNRSTFEKAVALVREAPAVCVVGLRAAAPLAEYLGYNLQKIKDGVTTLTSNGSVGYDILARQPKGAVAVVVAFPRYLAEVVRLAQAAREMALPIVGLTDNPLSPVARLADVALVVPYGVTFITEAFAAPMALINALLAAVGLSRERESLARLDRLERVFARHELFVRGETAPWSRGSNIAGPGRASRSGAPRGTGGERSAANGGGSRGRPR